MRYFVVLAVLFIAVPGPSGAAPSKAQKTASGDGAQVESFSPQGTVKGIRQVTARFSEPMVRFGDSRGTAPFHIDCPATGQGHWLDNRIWVYDFADDLAAGLKCAFTLNKALKSLAGRAVVGPPQFAFNTGGPAVTDSLPGEGNSGIDDNQRFILALDAPISRESVASHVHCEIEGLGEQIEADLLAGADRQSVLSPKLRDEFRYFFERFPDEKAIDERLVVVQCRRSFPPDTAVRVIWGQGIAATGSGLTTTQDQTLAFRTRTAFTARFECERVNAQAQCVPFLPMKLFFSAPVAADQAQAIRLEGRDGHAYAPEAPNTTAKPAVESVVFKGPFPASSKFEIRLPENLTDDAGRKLDNAGRFPFEVATDEYPPLAKFSGEFGIIEAKEGGILPVTLRNVEDTVAAQKLGPGAPTGPAVPGQWQRIDDDDAPIIGWLKKVKTAAERRGEWIEAADQQRWKELTGSTSVFEGTSGTTTFSVPKPLGGRAFEVVGIPLTQPGFYVVELASPRLGAALLGEPAPRYVATSALVTNLAVHFKWGRESSRVWVTTLDRAKPVPKAEIRINGYCKGNLLWRGVTGPDGLATIAGSELPAPNDERECGEWNESSPPLFVSARNDGDLGFTVSGWNQGIQPSDFGLATGSVNQTRSVHAVLDRTLLRADETVSMKLLLRQRVMDGFAIPKDGLPNQLRLTHSGSGQEYPLPIAFDDRGVAESNWPIPRDAKLGGYDIRLYRDDQWLSDAGQFQVQQFRVPTMRAVIQPGTEPLINADSATVDLFVGYLSGGGAAGLPVKLRTQTRPRAISYPDYEDFTFGGQDLAEGLQDETDDETEDAAKPARTLPLTLDRAGSVRATVPDLPTLQAPQDLIAELEYADANGERLSVAQRIPLWPAKLNLGLRTENWAASKNQLRFQVLALDLQGKPMSGQSVKVELFGKTTFSYRKRLVGGFYAYENQSELKHLEPVCESRTDRLGLASCELKPGISGEILLKATAQDDRGNTALATREVWVAAGDDWWFEGGLSDRMDVLPERASYEAGETARFQVRSPFREATALVTVEREGVIDAFVTELSGKSPVVDLPIKPHYAPNVFVSVLAVRGRATESFAWLKELGRTLQLTAQETSVTATVDLNKPAYRLGTRGIDVGWKPYRLDVRVTPERETYKVREQAKVKLAVARADGGPLPDSAEFAFAAVDEGLLELKPNTSWRLLDDMMNRRGIEVFTSTAQMQVVGKRHYGRKAVPHGGGGGRQAARELFDTLLLWRGRVPLNADGSAELDVPLNDSITGFRLTAVANAGTGHFGTGDATIHTTQDLALHSGLPPLVREGDAFTAIFTARNASNRTLTVDTSGKLAAEPASAALPEWAPQSVTLKPGEAREIVWTLTVPPAIDRLTWDLTATERDGGDAQDRVKLTQTVIPAVPVRVQQATLIHLDQPVRMEIERPADALPGRGGMHIDLQSTLGDGGDGVRDYMRHYPYSCLEQRISKAVALRDRLQWDSLMAQLPSFTDSDGLLKYFPGDQTQGSDTMTSYVLAIAHEAGWPLPAELQTRTLAALKSFAEGRLSRRSVLPTADGVLRKLAAIEALTRYGQAQPTLLGSLAIEPNFWPTSAVLDWLGILQRLNTVPRREARLQDALQILRSRLTFRGTTAGFSTEADDRLPWLMTGADANMARMILSLSARTDWREDLPRLVSGTLGRQTKGHWDTTLANAWGTLAMEKFSAAFQGSPVNGATEIKLAEQTREWRFSPDHSRGAVDFPWPSQAAWLELEHQGQGTPWATVQSRAAIPLQADNFNGYSIRRTVQPIEQRQAGVWSRGDVARIHLDLEAQADMAWVVVDDPVPAGASILGTGLGRDSALLTAGEHREGWVWPIYEERRFDAFRAYYDYVPKGKWTVEYTVRLNNQGRFVLPPTRVEALYAPEVYGEAPNPVAEIGE